MLVGGVLINWVALKNGFYTYPRLSSNSSFLPFKSVLIAFAIYLSLTTVVGGLLISIAQNAYQAYHIMPLKVLFGLVQLLVILAAIFLLYLFVRLWPQSLKDKVFKDRSSKHPSTIALDCAVGAFTWILSFPIVLIISEVTDWVLYYFTGFEQYEQVAVHYLKMALMSPGALSIALFIILIAAPAVEEFLFRGCLQTYLKQRMSRTLAIICSSACFALFHFSVNQGLGNISLLVSLFCFALFLGFIYERQGSLFASFALHVTFNTISTVRLIFFEV